MATLEEVLDALNNASADARETLTKMPQIAQTNGDVPFTFSDGTQISLPGLPKLKSEVDNFVANGRKEFGVVNLLKNTRFVDSNNDGFPDGYYTYYPSGATKTYTLITPDKSSSDGSDAKIASQLLAKAFTGNENDDADWTHWYESSHKVLKVTLQGFPPYDPSQNSLQTAQWSFNQNTYIPAGSVITRGVTIYIPQIYQDVSFSILDNPGGVTYDGLDNITNKSGFFNLYAVQRDTSSGNLGFLLKITNSSSSTQDVVFYVGFPVLTLGYAGTLYIPEINR